MSNKNDRWSALSLKDRADLMNMYITNGISDLKEMKKHYNSFSGEEDIDNFDIEPAIITGTSNLTNTFFKDFSDRYYNYHGKNIEDKVQKVLSKDTKRNKSKTAPYYNPITDEITLSPNSNAANYTHELTHKLNNSFPKRIRRTRSEKKLLKDAYPLGNRYDAHGKLYGLFVGPTEYFTTNTELRRRISQYYGNVTGNELNDVINNMSDEQLAIFAGASGYNSYDDFYVMPSDITDGKSYYNKYRLQYEDSPEWDALSDKQKELYEYWFKTGFGKRFFKTYDENKLKLVRQALINIAANGGELNSFSGEEDTQIPDENTKQSKDFLFRWYNNPTTRAIMNEAFPFEKVVPYYNHEGKEFTGELAARGHIANAIYNTPEFIKELEDNVGGRYIHDLRNPHIIYNKNYIYNNDKVDPRIATHELTHALQYALPQNTLRTSKHVKQELKEGVVPDEYYDSMKEIGARVNTFRNALNLNPEKRDYSPEDAEALMNTYIERFGEDATSKLNRFTPETLAGYLNYLAYNNKDVLPTFNSDVNYASNGGKLNVFSGEDDVNFALRTPKQLLTQTLNGYIQHKADSIRQDALEKSLNRVEGIEISYPSTPESLEESKKVLEDFYFLDPSFIGPLSSSQEYNANNPYYNDKYNQAKKEIENNCDYGSNCMGTATDNYPLDSRTVSTKDFIENFQKYGFVEVPFDQVLPGDITIVPGHGMIFDSYDKNGKPRFNYANGNLGPSNYRKQKNYSTPLNNYRSFRYVGTPELIQQWTKEYNNKKSSDGKILSGEEDTNKKPFFDPQKIVDNVPAREWGPQIVLGENDYLVKPGTNMLAAPIQYYADKNTGKQNIETANKIISDFESLEDKQRHIDEETDTYLAYLDALHYLNHAEALKKYLGLPYDTNRLKESNYKPTRLQGSDEKVYKFSNEEDPKYWGSVVNDMLLGNHNKKQYIDGTLNTFTAYRDFDDKGDFISIYDEWDYNPSVQGGFKPLNKIIDVATGGEPFIIYDRIYLDDYFDIPEEFRGNPYITPAILTDTNAYMSTDYGNGGKLLTKKQK